MYYFDSFYYILEVIIIVFQLESTIKWGETRTFRNNSRKQLQPQKASILQNTYLSWEEQPFLFFNTKIQEFNTFSRANRIFWIFLGYFYFPLELSKSSVITPSTPKWREIRAMIAYRNHWQSDIKFLINLSILKLQKIHQGWVLNNTSCRYCLEGDWRDNIK